MERLPEIVWLIEDEAQRSRIISLVTDLLRVLPSPDIAGLARVELRNCGERDRKKTQWQAESRARETSRSRRKGYYSPARRGAAPYIVLQLDRVFTGVPVETRPRHKLALLVPLAQVLYLEIGHHVAQKSQTVYRQTDANVYLSKMFRRLIKKRWYFFLGALAAVVLNPANWRDTVDAYRLFPKQR